MAKSKPLPPLEELQKILSYDPETGVFTWIVKTSSRALAGSVAGCINSTGYRKIRVDREEWMAHRLAWLFETGDDPGFLTVDHINQDKDDNRFQNLRLATRSQQQGNQPVRSSNKSGFKGVSWESGKKMWRASLHSKNCKQFLGHFSTREEAAEAYQKAAADYFGEFLAS